MQMKYMYYLCMGQMNPNNQMTNYMGNMNNIGGNNQNPNFNNNNFNNNIFLIIILI